MNIQLKWFYRLGFLLLVFIVLFLFWKLKQLWSPFVISAFKILTPFFIAAFITYLLNPFIETVHSFGINRGVAASLIYVLFFGSLSYFIYKGTPIFIRELRELSENIPLFTSKYEQWIVNIQTETSTWPVAVQEQIIAGIELIDITIEKYLQKIMNSSLQIVNVSILIALIPFIAFYMIKDYQLIKRSLWYVTPSKWREKSVEFVKDVDKTLGAYLRGQIILCLIVGILSALLFYLIGMKYALLLGLIVGITNIIPYFGPIIGAVPAVLIAATMSVKMVVFVSIIILVVQFLEGSLLSPVIVGKTLQMHPLIIIFALLVGSELGGVIGLILIVPIFAVSKVAIIHFRHHFLLKTVETNGE